MVDIRNVTKNFGAVRALNGISFAVPQGEVIGILGPNGAGKTTLFKIIAGLLQPDQGTVTPLRNQWPAIALKQERLLFPNHLTLHQYLTLTAHISNVPPLEIPRVVQSSLLQVGLAAEAHKRIRGCSKGMRQRLSLAQALIGSPDLLLLDEPTNGLDPNGQQEIQQLIKALHAQGKTILISSHQLAEVTQICTMLVILNNGRIHYQKSMSEALSVPKYVQINVDRDVSELAEQLHAIHEKIDINERQILIYGEAMPLRREIMTMLLQAGYDVVHVEQHTHSLADIYAEVIQ
ncbi:MAG: ABC transporter ATP-binding protein [Candidatus Promineifilaceae bacterium]